MKEPASGEGPGTGAFALKQMDVRAVMFDLDGTLIDSIPTYFRITEAMLDRVGLPRAPREAVAATIKEGLSGFHHLIPDHMAEREEELTAACLEAGREISAQLYPGAVSLIPGARALFLRLAEADVRIGLVTASHTEFIQRKLSPLKEAGIDGLIDALIAIEDTCEHKPSPEPVTACLRRLGVSEERSIYVGDADVDVVAGKRAGVFTIGVLTGVDDRETLARQRPDLIVAGIEDLIPLF